MDHHTTYHTDNHTTYHMVKTGFGRTPVKTSFTIGVHVYRVALYILLCGLLPFDAVEPGSREKVLCACVCVCVCVRARARVRVCVY
jgi:hypothetical protein